MSEKRGIVASKLIELLSDMNQEAEAFAYVASEQGWKICPIIAGVLHHFLLRKALRYRALVGQRQLSGPLPLLQQPAASQRLLS